MFGKIEDAEIQEENPWNDDALKRKPIAEFLTRVIEDTRTPFIFCLNSPWGSGKTFFIKRWMKDINRKHPCIYYNAWEDDFTDSPFLTFFSSIKKSIIEISPSHELKGKLQNLAKKSGRILLRSVPIILKGGLRYLVGDSGIESIKNIIDNESEKELSKDIGDWASQKIESQIAQKESIVEFRNLLSETISVLVEKSSFTAPLIIFIDELDRCRPTFTIELIENLKHIFSVPGIVFVLSTDSNQLSHSLKSTYGYGIDSDAYLRKIIDQQFNLPRGTFIQYTQVLQNKYQISTNWIYNLTAYEPVFLDTFANFSESFNLSLRDQEQSFIRIKAVYSNASYGIHFSFITFLIMTSLKYPSLYDEYRTSKINLSKLISSVKDNLIILNKLNRYFDIFNYYAMYLYELGQLRGELELSQNSPDKNQFKIAVLSYIYDNHDYIKKYKDLVDLPGHFG